jgi:hypothetical protein
LKERVGRPRFTKISERSPFLFNPEVLLAGSGSRLGGYFQSYKYFDSVASEIREEVTSIIAPSPWFFETKQLLDELGRWVAVHVRRGDYLNPGIRGVHGLLSDSYYTNALKTMEMLIPGAIPVVFSDDTDAARAMLEQNHPNAIFLQSPKVSKSIESLVLMSMSSGCVIANSSYSWWGAWLGDHADRPVIAPRPWMDDLDAHERDLLPISWLTLGRN